MSRPRGRALGRGLEALIPIGPEGTAGVVGANGIPEHIEVDVSGLEAVDDSIRVGQLNVPPECDVLNDPEELVVKISVIREVEEEEVVVAEGEEGEAVEGEAAEAAEGAAGGEADGGESTSGGSGPAEES